MFTLTHSAIVLGLAYFAVATSTQESGPFESNDSVDGITSVMHEVHETGLPVYTESGPWVPTPEDLIPTSGTGWLKHFADGTTTSCGYDQLRSKGAAMNLWWTLPTRVNARSIPIITARSNVDVDVLEAAQAASTTTLSLVTEATQLTLTFEAQPTMTVTATATPALTAIPATVTATETATETATSHVAFPVTITASNNEIQAADILASLQTAHSSTVTITTVQTIPPSLASEHFAHMSSLGYLENQINEFTSSVAAANPTPPVSTVTEIYKIPNQAVAKAAPLAMAGLAAGVLLMV